MITNTGWQTFSIWEHAQSVEELYAKRCLRQAEEMTCHAQAATLLAPLVKPGDTVLDVGCGAGYFFHSLRRQGVPVEYYGIDAAAPLIEIGRKHLPQFGLPAERLQPWRIEDLDGQVDHVVCMNVLSNLDNFHRPLERLLRCARKSVILRESSKDGSEYLYVKDKYLDPGVDLKVHVNAYDTRELMDFIRSYGYEVESVRDQYTGGHPELVIDYPHHWKFFVAKKKA